MATQQSRALFPKELGSNLSFRINVKTAVNSFRVDIRGAQSHRGGTMGDRAIAWCCKEKNPWEF